MAAGETDLGIGNVAAAEEEVVLLDAEVDPVLVLGPGLQEAGRGRLLLVALRIDRARQREAALDVDLVAQPDLDCGEAEVVAPGLVLQHFDVEGRRAARQESPPQARSDRRRHARAVIDPGVPDMGGRSGQGVGQSRSGASLLEQVDARPRLPQIAREREEAAEGPARHRVPWPGQAQTRGEVALGAIEVAALGPLEKGGT